MGQMREEFGRSLRDLLDRRRMTYRQAQELTGVSFSQIGEMCRGLVRTRGQVAKVIAGLKLDPVEWMLKAGYVPDGLERGSLLHALLPLGEVVPVPGATFAAPHFDRVSAGPGAPDPEAPLGGTVEVLAPFDYTVRVRGDSMSGVLEDGDVAFVKQQEHAAPGDLVVAWVRDSVVVKRFRKTNGMVTLASANHRYEEIPVSEVRILGIVTGMYRRP